MQYQIVLMAAISALAMTAHSAPIAQSSIPTSSSPGSHTDDIVSNSLSPLSDNAAGDNNKNTGILDGNDVNASPDIGRRQSHMDDIISNSVSPLSDNAAGNGNENTGVLDGNGKERKRSTTDDVASNSLSPFSDNAAGNGNKNTGTLDGNTVEVDPTVDPSVNVAPTVDAKRRDLSFEG